MALREILTHHGGSAGVFNSDLSLDGVLDELKYVDYSSTIKRESGIDLNMQVSVDELEPNLKKPKLEELPSLSTDVGLPLDCVDNLNTSIKVEDGGLYSPGGQVNGQVDVSTFKIDKDSLLKPDIRRNLPENCELMSLVKLARHSWVKNSEFLQDCAIRFLCILSLDR